jgi:AraC-like DNA-binding protein
MYFFKQVTGQSFINYLNHFRIAKAQSLLATTHLPIAEISQETGFCDQSHFGVVFRRLAGTTPLNYRRRFGTGRESLESTGDDAIRKDTDADAERMRTVRVSKSARSSVASSPHSKTV